MEISWKIEINNIFKGCNSLLIIPDISKWNISNPESVITPSLNSNSYSFSIKEIKSDSILSENIMENAELSRNFSSFNYNNNNENKGFSNDEELDNYYDNFYN